ncbi:hypothetical protein OCU04_005564 [Sclerotinia nivalis]|uniref:Uncharacterized protein n=1 Tax=Sclerotinia nivalis TaxID=352851 RepID=A0A9X0APD9_9HELO|nr:hypothetical protein OCU04_005564 [Sclerotinia nivalis]
MDFGNNGSFVAHQMGPYVSAPPLVAQHRSAGTPPGQNDVYIPPDTLPRRKGYVVITTPFGSAAPLLPPGGYHLVPTGTDNTYRMVGADFGPLPIIWSVGNVGVPRPRLRIVHSPPRASVPRLASGGPIVDPVAQDNTSSPPVPFVLPRSLDPLQDLEMRSALRDVTPVSSTAPPALSSSSSSSSSPSSS